MEKALAVILPVALIFTIMMVSAAYGPQVAESQASPAPMTVGPPPDAESALKAELASVIAKLNALEVENGQLKQRAENFNTQLSAARDARDKLLVKSTPQVSPARKVPPVVYRSQATGGGYWVDVPVYGPLGRQRGTRREWRSNQVQYRGNCVNGVCR